jgi:hypothetical protein
MLSRGLACRVEVNLGLAVEVSRGKLRFGALRRGSLMWVVVWQLRSGGSCSGELCLGLVWQLWYVLL